MNKEKEPTKRSKFAIFSVMARLLYVITVTVIIAVLCSFAMAQLWLPYWIITGRNYFNDIYGLNDDIKGWFNVP